MTSMSLHSSAGVAARLRFAWVVLPVVLVGCDVQGSGPTIQGTLGKLSFAYSCVADSDPQCDPKSEVAPKLANASFPAIAVGSRFGIVTTNDAASNLTTDVVPGSDFFQFEQQSGAFVALRSGFGTVVATRSSGDVVDLGYLRFDDPARLRILQAAQAGNFESGTIQINPGGVSGSVKTSTFFTFRVVAENQNGELLAGAFPVTWTNSNTSVAVFRNNDPTRDNIVELESKGAGTSTITVSFGKLTSSFDLVVSP